MPRRIHSPDSGARVGIALDGQPVEAVPGEPVACSVLASGETLFSRSIKYHRPRGPYCFSGACSHCLMRVDGVPNVYTCQTPARQGMQLERQNAYPSAKVDVFATVDWFFPRGLNHHEMFAGVPIAEQVMARVARELAGLGLVPDKQTPARKPVETRRVRVAILGGGAAGLGAAKLLAGSDVDFVVVEREREVGGRLIAGPRAESQPSVPDLSSSTTRLEATAIGLYDDDAGKYAAVVMRSPEPRLVKLYADRFIVALGGHPQLLPFINNDLPGVYAGRAAVRLLRRHGVTVGDHPILVGHGEELLQTAKEFEAAGVSVAAMVDMRGTAPASAKALVAKPERAHGRGHVTGLSVRTDDGKKRRIEGDAIVCVLPLSPAFELAEQGGARSAFDPVTGVFAVVADEAGRTDAKDVFVAGEVRGPMSAETAWRQGERVAGMIVQELAPRAESGAAR